MVAAPGTTWLGGGSQIKRKCPSLLPAGFLRLTCCRAREQKASRFHTKARQQHQKRRHGWMILVYSKISLLTLSLRSMLQNDLFASSKDDDHTTPARPAARFPSLPSVSLSLLSLSEVRRSEDPCAVEGGAEKMVYGSTAAFIGAVPLFHHVNLS